MLISFNQGVKNCQSNIEDTQLKFIGRQNKSLSNRYNEENYTDLRTEQDME